MNKQLVVLLFLTAFPALAKDIVIAPGDSLAKARDEASATALAASAAYPSPPGAKALMLSYNTPGDARTALPIGNGDIGVSAWVEPSGDLVLLIGKTDSWCEQSRLLKVGKVRVKFEPALATTNGFSQTLSMHDGLININGGGTDAVRLRLWVDANHPVIHLEATAAKPVVMTATLELWRTEERVLPGHEAPGVDAVAGNEPVRVWPDTIVDRPEPSPLKNHLLWYHRNEKSAYPVTLQVQGLETAKGIDPLLNRTFGCAIGGKGFEVKSPTTLVSAKAAEAHSLAIHPLTLQTPTAEAWLQALAQQTAAESARDATACYAAHAAWWRAFWNRSWIEISGGLPQEQKEIANINTGWHAHRYLVACGGRGKFPVKFNGGIFNIEKFGRDGEPVGWMTPDYRNWGSGFWFQNQRHIYWPMLAAGDYDQMPPFFKMYRDALALAQQRTEIYYGHAGAFFPETMNHWGTHVNAFYGWNRNGKKPEFVDCGYIYRYWQGGLELSAMMLDYYRHTGDTALLKETFLPVMTEVITFYDQHYKRGSDGKLFISPAQVLETYWDVDNPMPEIAGLKACLQGLLALPEGLASARQRDQWQRLLGELPPLPTKDVDGKTSLWDAQNIRPGKYNAENGRLYAVWPYRLFGVGMPDLDKAVNGWNTRPHKFGTDSCWHNDIIWGAYLGMPGEARHALGDRFTRSGPFRFPAMYIVGDWVPDHDNGGVCQNTIQSMLMQAIGDRILLLPAWPKEWDVKFKLHAPKNTAIECEVKNGAVIRMTVTPESRRRDVEACPPFVLPPPSSAIK